MNSFQVFFSNFNTLRRYSTAYYATSCQGEWKLVVDVHLEGNVRVPLFGSVSIPLPKVGRCRLTL